MVYVPIKIVVFGKNYSEKIIQTLEYTTVQEKYYISKALTIKYYTLRIKYGYTKNQLGTMNQLNFLSVLDTGTNPQEPVIIKNRPNTRSCMTWIFHQYHRVCPDWIHSSNLCQRLQLFIDYHMFNNMYLSNVLTPCFVSELQTNSLFELVRMPQQKFASRTWC